VAGSIAAEQSVLGALMLETSRASEIELCAEDFTRDDHRSIFRAIMKCVDRRHQADAVTVAEILEREEGKDTPWLVYCASLVRDTPSAANIRAYANYVKRYADAQRAIKIAQDMMARVEAEPEAIDHATRDLMRLTTSTSSSYSCALADTLGEVVDYIDYRYTHRDELPGLSTGLQKLDRNTGGLCKGHLIVVAARPGMGKTAFMSGLHLANRKRPTGIMSAEMPRAELVLRMVSSVAEVAFEDLKMGTIRDDQWPAINSAFNLLKTLPIYINDRSAPTIEHVMRQARQWKYEHDIQLFSLDYLQRMPTPGRIEKRNEGVEHIVRCMKELARELEIPVVALSAVNRSVEARADKRPLMGDLRDSGAIEAEADVIVTLYRDEVYDATTSNAGVAELSAIKNRHGKLGRATVHYNGPTVTFSDFGIDSDGSGGLSGGDGTPQRGLELGQREDDRVETRRVARSRARKPLQEIHKAQGG
jgi:replicative DNA helicase